MKKIALIITTLSICLLVLSGCTKSTINTSLDKEVNLAIGQTVKISSENLSIKLTDVTNESRCPLGVQCIRAGDVTCVLEITLNGSTEALNLIVSGNTEQIYKGYKLIADVTPYPKAEETISKDDYRLKLTVSKT